MTVDGDPGIEEIRRAVGTRYSAIGGDPEAEVVIPVGRTWAEQLGYPPSLLDTVPARALSSFTGIGAPVLSAGLVSGEHVLDLGCGSGLDTVLAARQVAPEGQVHGVDLAAGMLAAAGEAVAEAELSNVTLWEASAEELPLPDASMDVAVVNGIFNLTPDKYAVASELRRVLRPGGRIVGAEIVITDDRGAQGYDPESWFR